MGAKQKKKTTKGTNMANPAQTEKKTEEKKHDEKPSALSGAAPAQAATDVVALPFKPDPYKVVKMPLRLIHADHSWNNRAQGALLFDETNAESTSEERGIGGMVATLKARGQDDPVVVRPHPRGAKAKAPYSLVKGFRRYVGLEKIAAEGEDIKGPNWEDWTAKEPYILAIVKDLDETEALIENAEENLTRQNLNPPDASRAVARLLAAPANMTQTQVAEKLGKTQGYIAKLAKVRFLHEKVFSAWRDARVQLSVDEIGEIAKHDKDRHEEEYSKLLAAKIAKLNAKGGRGAKDANAWYEAAKSRCDTVGAMLGRLEANEAIVVDPTADEGVGASVDHFDTHLKHFIPGVKQPSEGEAGATQEQRRTLATLLHGAYKKARTEGRAEQDAAAEAATQGKGKGKGKGKNASVPAN